MRILLILLMILAGCETPQPAADAGVDSDTELDGDVGIDADVEGDADVEEDAEPVDWSACVYTSDCILVLGLDCCPREVPATYLALDAVNRNFVAEHDDDVCTPPLDGCEDVVPSDVFAVSNVFATCEDGHCRLYTTDYGEVAHDPSLESCDGVITEEQCTVRYNSCCECDVPQTVEYLVPLAIEHVELYESLICDPGETCDCTPSYPTESYCEGSQGECTLR